MNRLQQVLGCGLLFCATSLLMPMGCANSIATAPLRYRAENAEPRLPDMTVERLQACVEEYGGQLDEDSYRVSATVQVDQDGRPKDVQVTGIPERAPDLAACTRITLGDMAVSVSSLPLRSVAMTNGQTMSRGNEAANPLVLVEAAAALAEFLAEHGGRMVLYAVTAEVLTTAAVVATQQLVRRKKKDRCTDHYEKCVESSLWRKYGRHEWDSLCSLCASVCFGNGGTWPSSVSGKDCSYRAN